MAEAIWQSDETAVATGEESAMSVLRKPNKHRASSDANEELSQGCRQKFLFFIKHSYRDVSRHPCHFCLAFCVTFIVVLATLVVQTVIDQGPVIFLNIAQA